jgi:hypothetical protein
MSNSSVNSVGIGVLLLTWFKDIRLLGKEEVFELLLFGAHEK